MLGKRNAAASRNLMFATIMAAVMVASRSHFLLLVSAMKPPHNNNAANHQQMKPSRLFGSSASNTATASNQRFSRNTGGDDSFKGGVFHRKNTKITSKPISSTPIAESPSRFGFSPIVTPQCAAVSMASRIILERRQRQEGGRSAAASATTNARTTSSALRGGSSTVLLASSSTVLPTILPSSWMLPAVTCAASYALYNLFIKKAASNSMDPILGGVLLQFVAALIGSCLWLGQRLLASINPAAAASTTTLMITKSGIMWSVAAGVAVGAAEILSFVVSGKGVPATQSIPIIVGGSILVGTLLGSVWLQERLSRTGWMGVLLIAAGIALVGMDGVGGH
jgi:transporter family protein